MISPSRQVDWGIERRILTVKEWSDSSNQFTTPATSILSNQVRVESHKKGSVLHIQEWKRGFRHQYVRQDRTPMELLPKQSWRVGLYCLAEPSLYNADAKHFRHIPVYGMGSEVQLQHPLQQHNGSSLVLPSRMQLAVLVRARTVYAWMEAYDEQDTRVFAAYLPLCRVNDSKQSPLYLQMEWNNATHCAEFLCRTHRQTFRTTYHHWGEPPAHPAWTVCPNKPSASFRTIAPSPFAPLTLPRSRSPEDMVSGSPSRDLSVSPASESKETPPPILSASSVALLSSVTTVRSLFGIFDMSDVLRSSASLERHKPCKVAFFRLETSFYTHV